MSEIDALHEQSMDIAEEAFSLKRKGNQNEAIRLFRQALDLERKAASAFPAEPSAEPTRSILYRSAASLAFHANDFKAAQSLVAHGLTGYPPPEIERELYNLKDEIDAKIFMPPRRIAQSKST